MEEQVRRRRRVEDAVERDLRPSFAAPQLGALGAEVWLPPQL